MTEWVEATPVTTSLQLVALWYVLKVGSAVVAIDAVPSVRVVLVPGVLLKTNSRSRRKGFRSDYADEILKTAIRMVDPCIDEMASAPKHENNKIRILPTDARENQEKTHENVFFHWGSAYRFDPAPCEAGIFFKVWSNALQ